MQSTPGLSLTSLPGSSSAACLAARDLGPHYRHHQHHPLGRWSMRCTASHRPRCAEQSQSSVPPPGPEYLRRERCAANQGHAAIFPRTPPADARRQGWALSAKIAAHSRTSRTEDLVRATLSNGSHGSTTQVKAIERHHVLFLNPCERDLSIKLKMIYPSNS